MIQMILYNTIINYRFMIQIRLLIAGCIVYMLYFGKRPFSVQGTSGSSVLCEACCFQTKSGRRAVLENNRVWADNIDKESMQIKVFQKSSQSLPMT